VEVFKVRCKTASIHVATGRLGRNNFKSGKLTWMGTTKAIRKQAATAERVATQTADSFVADQMKSLADAFRAQADVLKRKKKKKKK
jgi:hypothetical protein